MREAIRRKWMKVVGKYVIEIAIIFVGITISFAFEQWREQQRKKQALIELSKTLLTELKTAREELEFDLPISADWIAYMDSIRVQGAEGRLSADRANWFYKMVTGQEMFLFDSHLPTYAAASATNEWSELLPDSLRAGFYRVHQDGLEYLKLSYAQQQENLTHFRLSLLEQGASPIPFVKGKPFSPDAEAVKKLIQQSHCQNLIQQTLITEHMCYQQNKMVIGQLKKLETSLRLYLRKLSGE